MDSRSFCDRFCIEVLLCGPSAWITELASYRTPYDGREDGDEGARTPEIVDCPVGGCHSAGKKRTKVDCAWGDLLPILASLMQRRPPSVETRTHLGSRLNSPPRHTHQFAIAIPVPQVPSSNTRRPKHSESKTFNIVIGTTLILWNHSLSQA